MESAESSSPISVVAESGVDNIPIWYRPLHFAILTGDWKSTKAFLDNDPNALTAKITMLDQNALHVAALGCQWKLVEKLVQLMPADILTERDSKGFSCLHYVAFGKSVDTAKALVAKNSSVTQVTDNAGFRPLMHSLGSTSCKEMAWYLVLNNQPNERSDCRFYAEELLCLLSAGFNDIAMYILQRYPNLIDCPDSEGASILLDMLTTLPSHFQSGHNFGFWKRCIYRCVPVKLGYGNRIWNALETLVPSIKLVRDAKLRHVYAVRLVEFLCSQDSVKNDRQFWQSPRNVDVIVNATSYGIVEILSICFRLFPDLIWTHKPKEGYIANVAIKNRQEKVFSFLCKMPSICKMQLMQIFLSADEFGNYIHSLHMAAKFASQDKNDRGIRVVYQVESTPGAAFQMQRELQWFKEVEKLVNPVFKNVEIDGKTPWQLFNKEHEKLLEEGKKWMEVTSNSCMLVATLIATIAFAAAITVPGGNQDKGLPIFLSDNTFIVFVISDALALFSSMTSLLMFLAILNARFAAEDFLITLPQKLIIGLAFLFLAIVTTMVAFGAALSMLVQERLKWAPIPITLLASVPIALFAILQLPLLVEMIISTYGSRFS